MQRVRKLAMGLAVMLLSAAPASAANFTWTGAAPLTGPSSMLWSNGQNWAGGSAPSGSVGTLSFPRLTGPCASMSSSSNACYSSQNDVTGLSANAITLDDTSGYLLMGDPLTIGAGGLTAAPGGSCPCGIPLIAAPLTLGASQSWSIDRYTLNIAGDVSGAGAALRITTSRGGVMVLGGDDEVGPVTLAGADPKNPSGNGQVLLLGIPAPTPLGPGGPVPAPPPIGSTPAHLNGRDGDPVTISNTSLFFANAIVGPLTSAGGEIAGAGSPTVGALSVNGGLSVDRQSAMAFFFNGGSSTRITATGPVQLGGTLYLDIANSTGFGANQPCQTLPAGTIYTPIATTGALTGTFSFLLGGDEALIECARGIVPAVRVQYTSHSLQLTVLPARGGVLLPQREAPVSHSGRGGVFVACRGPSPCIGKIMLPRGLAVDPVSYGVGSGGTSAFTFQLTGGGRRRLRRHHGSMRIRVTVRPRGGRAFKVSQTLTLY
jgi:hypothetical protein